MTADPLRARAEQIANTYHAQGCDCPVEYNKPLGPTCQKIADAIFAALSEVAQERDDEHKIRLAQAQTLNDWRKQIRDLQAQLASLTAAHEQRATWIEPLVKSDDPEEADGARFTSEYVLMARDLADRQSAMHMKWRDERDALRAKLSALVTRWREDAEAAGEGQTAAATGSRSAYLSAYANAHRQCANEIASALDGGASQA